MAGVQSFREKRAFRRTIGRLCRSEVRSSNEESLLILGLLPASSFGDLRALGKVAERAGFERTVRAPLGRATNNPQFMTPSTSEKATGNVVF
jgi:hypothetical protein